LAFASHKHHRCAAEWFSLPEFFIKLLAEEDGIALEPFASSNTTKAVAERLERRRMADERVEDYLSASRVRFD
jgi:DNA modification methylase